MLMHIENLALLRSEHNVKAPIAYSVEIEVTSKTHHKLHIVPISEAHDILHLGKQICSTLDSLPIGRYDLIVRWEDIGGDLLSMYETVVAIKGGQEDDN